MGDRAKCVGQAGQARALNTGNVLLHIDRPAMSDETAFAVPATPLRRATTTELLVVLGAPFLFFFASSLSWVVARAGEVVFTDARLLTTLAIEITLMALLVPFLRRRGWTPREASGRPEPRDAVRGVGLWLGCMGASYVAFLALYFVAPKEAQALAEPQFTGTASFPVGLATAVINPVFEEFLWLAYAIPALQSRIGLRAACVLSVALRCAVHLYQGPIVFVGVLPSAIVLTVYFVNTGRFWPVVVTHAIVDAVGLTALTLRGQ